MCMCLQLITNVFEMNYLTCPLYYVCVLLCDCVHEHMCVCVCVRVRVCVCTGASAHVHVNHQNKITFCLLQEGYTRKGIQKEHVSLLSNNAITTIKSMNSCHNPTQKMHTLISLPS